MDGDVGTEEDSTWTHSFKSSIGMGIIFEAAGALARSMTTDRKTSDGTRSATESIRLGCPNRPKRGRNSRKCKPAARCETPADSARDKCGDLGREKV